MSPPPPGPWELLVVAAQQDGVAPSLLLSSPGALGPQYLFNAPEGFARLALEHRVRPTGRLAAVFATGTGPPSLGGLPGLILRLSSDGHGEVSLVGPPGTVAHAHGLRHFIRWRHPKMYARDHGGLSPLVYRDSHVEVAAVTAGAPGWDDPWGLPAAAPAEERDRGDVKRPRGPGGAGEEQPQASKRTRPELDDAKGGGGGGRGPAYGAAAAGSSGGGEAADGAGTGGGSSGEEEESSSGEEESSSGEEESSSSEEESSSGEEGNATRPGGREAPGRARRPQEPFPPPPGPGHISAYLCRLVGLGAVVAVVDCPEGRPEVAVELVGHPAFAPLADGRLPCAAVVHLSPPAVRASAPYRRLVEGAAGWGAGGGRPPLQMAVGGADTGAGGGAAGDEVGHLASLRTLVRLNAAAPGLFPLPPDVEGGGGGGRDERDGEGAGGLARAGLLTRVLVGQAGGGGGGPGGGALEVTVDRSGCPDPVDLGALREQVQRERPLLAGLLEGLGPEGRAAAQPGPGAAAPGVPLPFAAPPAPPGWRPAPPAGAPAHPELTFLGTGCAEPSKYRGASAIHLRLPGGGGLLMDAGEGTLGQMRRRYGARGLPGALAGLRAAWISHRHADHCAGLPAVLRARPAGSPPLLVVGPAAVARWLAEVAPHGGGGPGYTFAHCRPFDEDPRLRGLRDAALGSLGLAAWQSVPVDHCSDAWALVVQGGGGAAPWWKLVYSGDTRPCPRLERAGYGCTLLVHEATFGPSLHDHAVRKRHSTTPEALGVAARMAAHRVILTHFSQRYPRLPEEDEGGRGAGGDGPGVGPHPPAAAPFFLAHDGMCVGLDRLGGLPSLRAAVRCVLEEGEEN